MCSSGGAQEPGRARDRGFTPGAPTERFCSPGVEGVQTPGLQRGQEERLKQILAEINVNLLNLPCLLLFPSAIPPPFPSYCCSSIASLSFPSHPSHSPLCPPLPFATHCLLLYFLFFQFLSPSLHLSTDFFPGENISPSGSVKTGCKKSPSHRFLAPQKALTQSHSCKKRDPNCMEIFVSCVPSSKWI